jgi:hypothetical protein
MQVKDYNIATVSSNNINYSEHRTFCHSWMWIWRWASAHKSDFTQFTYIYNIYVLFSNVMRIAPLNAHRFAPEICFVLMLQFFIQPSRIRFVGSLKT